MPDQTPQPDKQSFGTRLQQIRDGAGMSQQQLAAAIGRGQPDISRMENDRHDPQLGTLKALAEALGCTVGDLVPPF